MDVVVLRLLGAEHSAEIGGGPVNYLAEVVATPSGGLPMEATSAADARAAGSQSSLRAP